jgi:uncharacterized protein YndB with AHSA1/START domain
MKEHTVVHATFVIEHTFAAAPARVFAAFANPETKRRWFAEGERPKVREFSSDFRVGGREFARFEFPGVAGDPPGAPPAGSEMRNDTTFLDLIQDRRIVFAYSMSVGDKPFSASLATFVIEPSGHPAGTRSKVTFTWQGAFLDGGDGAVMREAGWRSLLASLEKELARGG